MADLPFVAAVALGLAGLGVGWFLNTVIVRAPDGRSLLSPPPECPACRARLGVAELVPVASYARQRGRCRSCEDPIPLGYPLVEVANAVLWVAAGYRFGLGWTLVPFLLLFSTLLAQSVIDLELYRLLDRITFSVLGASVVLVAAVSLIEGDPRRLVVALAGALGSFVFLFVPALVFPPGMGLGDVKLVALMGLYLGWIHPILCLFAMIAACLLGVVAGVVLYFARGRRSTAFPFGPWLALGCVLTILFSSAVFDLYEGTIEPPAFLALVVG